MYVPTALDAVLSTRDNIHQRGVIHATSGYRADLQAAINRAHTGDTVLVPAGRFSFKGLVLAPDDIYIKGAGRDSTYLVKSDDTSNFTIMVDSHPYQGSARQ
jgi:hypothetical protein